MRAKNGAGFRETSGILRAFRTMNSPPRVRCRKVSSTKFRSLSIISYGGIVVTRLHLRPTSCSQWRHPSQFRRAHTDVTSTYITYTKRSRRYLSQIQIDVTFSYLRSTSRLPHIESFRRRPSQIQIDVTFPYFRPTSPSLTWGRRRDMYRVQHGS